MKNFAYFYFMKNLPEKIHETVESHVAYWKNSDLDNYRGGPFGDRSGGLILFSAESLDDAIVVVGQDPFTIAGLLENSWVKEWSAE